jgi:hypothetical protein
VSLVLERVVVGVDKAVKGLEAGVAKGRILYPQQLLANLWMFVSELATTPLKPQAS